MQRLRKKAAALLALGVVACAGAVRASIPRGDALVREVRAWEVPDVDAQPSPAPASSSYALFAPPPRGSARHLFDNIAPPRVRVELDEIASSDVVAFSKTRVRVSRLGLFGQPPGPQRFSLKTAVGLRYGLWTDPVTGISYARARWYDARNANWLSEDPAGTVDSQSLYAFVGQQPNMGTDPTGLCLGLDNLSCFDWWLAGLETNGKAAVTLVQGAAHGVVKAADFVTMGQLSGTAVRLATFAGSGGSLTERAEAANKAANQHTASVVTFGFSSAPDKLQHAKSLVGGALGADAQRHGSATAFEGILEGDGEKRFAVRPSGPVAPVRQS